VSDTARDDDDIAYVRAAAKLLALPLPASCEPAVLGHFTRLAAFARLVAAHPLDLSDEPATLYVPGRRE
jgi:hypothetical protein